MVSEKYLDQKAPFVYASSMMALSADRIHKDLLQYCRKNVISIRQRIRYIRRIEPKDIGSFFFAVLPNCKDYF